MSGAPDPRPVKRLSRADASRLTTADYRRAWKQAVLDRDQGCCLADHPHPEVCDWPFQAHHVVLAQQLKRDGHGDALYDSRAGITLCSRAHRQHHARIRPVFLEEIPRVVLAFLDDLGYGDWIRRRYPERPA